VQGSGLSISDEQVRALARELLSREEFARWRRPPGAFERLRDRVAEWLRAPWEWIPDWLRDAWEVVKATIDEFLRMLVGDGPIATPLRWIVGTLLLAMVIAALVMLARALRGALSRSGSAAASATPAAREQSLLGEAERLAGLGRFLEAAHCAELAALELLLRRRWIELARSEPNRTLRQRLSQTSLPESERTEFVSLLDRLESHWFRDRTGDRDLYLAWCGLHTRLADLSGTP
jgi:hypothetical protein